MNIKDLKPRMGSVNLVVTVVDKGDAREFDKFGKKGRVCTATVQDDTGKVALTLWNEDVDKVGVGDKVEMANGWVGEYQGELQLSAGKFGQLKVLEKGAGKPAEAPKETPKDDKDDDEPSQAPYKDEEMVEDGDKEEEYY